jgi:polyketide cyclase/dehydrase/lipid transport protein
MASVRKELVIHARVEDVWDALRDWGAVHERLVPGFVVDARLDGPDRVVTFFNGVTVRELFVDTDDEKRRLVWSSAGGSLTHHNASAQVFGDGDGRTRFVWIADLLPHEAAEPIGEMMERGSAVLKETLEAAE